MLIRVDLVRSLPLERFGRFDILKYFAKSLFFAKQKDHPTVVDGSNPKFDDRLYIHLRIDRFSSLKMVYLLRVEYIRNTSCNHYLEWQMYSKPLNRK